MAVRSRIQALWENKINEEILNLSESIALGACSDMEHYRNQVGYIRGLKEAIRIFNDIQEDDE